MPDGFNDFNRGSSGRVSVRSMFGRIRSSLRRREIVVSEEGPSKKKMAEGYGNGGPSSHSKDVQKIPRLANEPKRKRFQPFRAVRRIFSRKSKLPYKEEEEDDEPNSNLKSRSTSELLVANCQDERSAVACQPYSSGLSLSHDSIFAPESEEVKSREKHFSHSPKRFSVKRIKEELMNKFRVRQDSDDDDDGLPHSPCTSPTTAEVLRQGLMLGTSEKFRSSDGSLLSMGSSGTDTEDYGGSRLVNVTSDPDLDVGTTVLLSNRAARHKISVRPKRTHAVPQNRRLNQVTAGSSLPTTPEDMEDAVLPGGRLLHTDSSDAKVLVKPVPSKRDHPRDVPVVPVKRQSRPVQEVVEKKEPVSPTEQEVIGASGGIGKSRAAERKRLHEIEKFKQREVRESKTSSNQKEKEVPSIPASENAREAETSGMSAGPTELMAAGSRLSANSASVPSRFKVENSVDKITDLNKSSKSNRGKDVAGKKSGNSPGEWESAFFRSESGDKVLSESDASSERLSADWDSKYSENGDLKNGTNDELENGLLVKENVLRKKDHVVVERESISSREKLQTVERESISARKKLQTVERENVSAREKFLSKKDPVTVERENTPAKKNSLRENHPVTVERENAPAKKNSLRENYPVTVERENSSGRENFPGENDSAMVERKSMSARKNLLYREDPATVEREYVPPKENAPRKADPATAEWENGSPIKDSALDDSNKVIISVVQKSTVRVKSEGLSQMHIPECNPVARSNSTRRLSDRIARLSQNFGSDAPLPNPASDDGNVRPLEDENNLHVLHVAGESANKTEPVSVPESDRGSAVRPSGSPEEQRHQVECVEVPKREAGRIPSLDDDVEIRVGNSIELAQKLSPDRALPTLTQPSRGSASKETAKPSGVPILKEHNARSSQALKDSRKRDISPPVSHLLARNRKERSADKIESPPESSGLATGLELPVLTGNAPLRGAQMSNQSKRQPVQQQLSQEDMNQLEEEQFSLSLPPAKPNEPSKLGKSNSDTSVSPKAAKISEPFFFPGGVKPEKEGRFDEVIPKENKQAVKKEIDVRIVSDSEKARNSTPTSVFASPERKISGTRLAPMEILPYTSSPSQSRAAKSRAILESDYVEPVTSPVRAKPTSFQHAVQDANPKSNVEPPTMVLRSKPTSPQHAVPEPVMPKKEMPRSSFQMPSSTARWTPGRVFKAKAEHVDAVNPITSPPANVVPEPTEVHSPSAMSPESVEVSKSGGQEGAGLGRSTRVGAPVESELNKVFEKRRSMKKKKDESDHTQRDLGEKRPATEETSGKDCSKSGPTSLPSPVEASNAVLAEKVRSGTSFRSTAQNKSRFMADLLLDGAQKNIDEKHGKVDTVKTNTVNNSNNHSPDAFSKSEGKGREDFRKSRSESVESCGGKKSSEGNVVEIEADATSKTFGNFGPSLSFKKEVSSSVSRPPPRDKFGIVIIEETAKVTSPVPPLVESIKRPHSIPVVSQIAEAPKQGRSYAGSKENAPSRSSSFNKVTIVAGRKFSSPSRIVISETTTPPPGDKLRESPKTLVSPTTAKSPGEKEVKEAGDVEPSAKTTVWEAAKASAAFETDRTLTTSTENPPDWMKMIQQRKEMKKQQTLMANDPPTTIIIDNKPTSNRSSKVLDMANTFQHRGLTS